jgi:putative zinc finger/helix-turn-helix YgiT family protein
MSEMDCPNEHGHMKKVNGVEEMLFRGISLRVSMEHFRCDRCGFEADDLNLAGSNQRAVADEYRQAVGLLTSEEIVLGRKERRWTQEELAKAIGVGVASVKRWEKGQIQTDVMDRAMRNAFADGFSDCGHFTGNRPFSLGRIKLVLQRFSELLGRDLLSGKGNRLLYGAKYLWFADMVCFRDSGRSITGATYAVLPQGPQLNNYAELIEHIRTADETIEDPLSDQEQRIIRRIAMTFPSNKAVYDASHDEPAWKSKDFGMLIPYADAETLITI